MDIKKECLTEDDRQLAEAHYKYALALEFSTSEADKAGSQIKAAIDVFKKRIATLEEQDQDQDQGKGKGKAVQVEEEKSDNKEIIEIKELIQDLDEKVSLFRRKTRGSYFSFIYLLIYFS